MCLVHLVWAMICLFFSSLFHLFSCHSKDATNILSRFDYGGIAILIAGTWVPHYLYTFWCKQNAYFGYIYTACIMLAWLGTFIVSLVPRFDAPKFRKYRAILFVILGISAGGPGVHILFFRDHKLSPSPPLLSLALGGALFIIGAVIYSTRFPERWLKGKVSFQPFIT